MCSLTDPLYFYRIAKIINGFVLFTKIFENEEGPIAPEWYLCFDFPQGQDTVNKR